MSEADSGSDGEFADRFERNAREHTCKACGGREPQVYSAKQDLRLNEWAVAGNWTVEGERALANGPDTAITFRFKARDLHLVLGAREGKAVRFKVLIDDKPPGIDHGGDVDANGEGTVTDERLYQLVRQKGPIREHQFEIKFLDAGAEAFAFTFG
jgi:hypothetical protein